MYAHKHISIGFFKKEKETTYVNTYQKVSRSLIDKFEKEFYSLIDNAYTDKIIDKQIREFVRTPYPVIPTFYSLPKVHKYKIPPPGRPIVSGCGSITENLSKFIDEQI